MPMIDANEFEKWAWSNPDIVVDGDGYVSPYAVSNFALDHVIEAEPVRHGRVVTSTDRWHTMHQNCSECGEELGWKEYPNYCHNCGAKMDGGADNES